MASIMSFPLGTPMEMLVRVDEALARYFNLQVSLVGGWGSETGVERGVVAAHVVAVLLGWDPAPDHELSQLSDEKAKRKFLAAMEGVLKL